MTENVEFVGGPQDGTMLPITGDDLARLGYSYWHLGVVGSPDMVHQYRRDGNKLIYVGVIRIDLVVKHGLASIEN